MQPWTQQTSNNKHNLEKNHDLNLFLEMLDYFFFTF